MCINTVWQSENARGDGGPILKPTEHGAYIRGEVSALYPSCLSIPSGLLNESKTKAKDSKLPTTEKRGDRH